MHSLFEKNGLVFWTEKEIQIRNTIERVVFQEIKDNLLSQNPAFQFFQLEAPTLIPKELIHESYDDEDVFCVSTDMAMRPETTKSSYEYALHLMNTHNEIKVRPPFVVWQHGKSYRNEQDQVVKNMRLKEFYQLEFQILYSSSTANDYSVKLIPAVSSILADIIGETYIEPSDRLPSYSLETTDVVCKKNDMEVCSISKRTDFPKENINVLEVAIGSDRCVYNFMNKR